MTCCCLESSWRERIFALDKANNAMLYFRTDEQFEQHCAQGAHSQAGTILLKNTVMYVADYMVRLQHTPAQASKPRRMKAITASAERVESLR